MNDLSYSFYDYLSLKELPIFLNGIWKIFEDINYIFCLCSSLISLLNISRCNTDNLNNLNNIFYSCSLLTFIPNISKWKFKNKIKK